MHNQLQAGQEKASGSRGPAIKETSSMERKGIEPSASALRTLGLFGVSWQQAVTGMFSGPLAQGANGHRITE